MASKPDPETNAMKQLQSRQSELLDKIDELRSIGVGGLVELPQLIVCGNQSSGKSSVLEAISRVRFPAKGNVCTRFATEVILRRSSQPRVKVSIEPGQTKSNKEERQRLRSFTFVGVSNGDDLPKVIEQAEKHMGLSDSGPDNIEFSDDVLRVEISGPEKPEITLVDLPGLYSSTSKEQSEAGIKIVRDLTERYMKNTRSIILAVISAKMDYHLQEVLNIAQRFDKKYERVLGIITQPDTLEEGSEEESNYLRILRNENTHLQFGWHALCNRSFKTKGCSDNERDERERDLFAKGNWTSIPRDSVGIDSLRTRLSKCLFDHICRTLPSLITDIEDKILDREQRLAKLGQERSSVQDQRCYLIDISSRFERIATQGLNGMYVDKFFGGLGASSGDGRRRKLRAIIRTLHEYFFDAMEACGCRRHVLESQGWAYKIPSFDISKPYMNISAPEYITRELLEKEIETKAPNNQGLELPGNANHMLVGSLFRDQVLPWEKIAHSHLTKCWESAKYFVRQVLEDLTDEHTLFTLTNVIIAPELERLREALEAKLEELTSNLKIGHPLPVGRGFLSKISKTRARRQADYLEKTLGRNSSLKDPTEDLTMENIKKASSRMQSSSDKFAAGDIIDQMQSYYDTAIVVFVDNVVVLAIENCLLRPLEQIFTSNIVNRMSDSQIQELAAEPEQVRNERIQLRNDLEKLRGGKRTLRIFSTNCLDPEPPSDFGSYSHFATPSSSAASAKPVPKPAATSSASVASKPAPAASTPAAAVKSLHFGDGIGSSPKPSLFSEPAPAASKPAPFGSSFGSTPKPSPFGGSTNPGPGSSNSGIAPTGGSLFGNSTASTLGSSSNSKSTPFFGDKPINFDIPAHKYPDTKDAFR